MPSNRYIGRFAPSPSGPLHMGSLLCALASYCEARHHQGQWLVRIEDIDPPREEFGASKHILRTLEAHELTWDGEVHYQSQRSDAYRDALASINTQGLSYRCTCSRKRIHANEGIYDGHCRSLTPSASQPAAIRLNLDKAAEAKGIDPCITIHDDFQVARTDDVRRHGDFIVHRKDGLFAYHLAVVVDDMDQGITHCVRGADLYPCCASQQFLTQLLGGTPLHYAHIPVLSSEAGKKLSKQHHAAPIDHARVNSNLYHALRYLQQTPPPELADASATEILAWATAHWNRDRLSSIDEVLLNAE